MKTLVTMVAVSAVAISAAAQTPPPAAPQPSIFDKAVNQPGIGWTVYGADQVAKQVPAPDVPGGAAVQVQVKRAGAHPWDAGAQYPTIKPVAAGDTLLAMVYLRAPKAAEGDGASIPISVGESDPPYASLADETVKVGAVWKRYFATGIATKAFVAGKARISVQLAGAKQVIEIGPAFLLDMGQNFDRSKLPHN